MTSHVHTFEGREGGTFRISLTYDAPTTAGKTTPHTDTDHGRFAAAAEAFEREGSLPDGARLRRVRVVRDYGMFDRREAPQYYPDVGSSHAAPDAERPSR